MGMSGVKEQLAGIAGKAHVTDDPAVLRGYARDSSLVPARLPGCVVWPGTAEEVQSIVRWANKTGTPLVPVSSGPPHFRGDTVPGADGALIVDLGRLKRIVRIDKRNRIAIVEAGVTYGELQPELAKEGLRVGMPLMPRPNKSVVASLLEREALASSRYQWSLMEPLRCLEVVWGDSSRMWTGEAGEYIQDLGEQERMKRAAVVGMGPGSVDYYRFVSAAQGTMGIATWASVKCEILPAVHKVLFVAADRLESLLGFVYEIERIRYGDELFLANRAQLSYMLAGGRADIRGLKKRLPPWAALLGIAGRAYLPEERVGYQCRDIGEIAKKHGLEPAEGLPGVSGDDALRCLEGLCEGEFWKLRYKGGNQEIFFLTTLDRTPAYVEKMFSVAGAMEYCCEDIGVYLQPQHQGVACHCEFNLPYAEEETEKAREILGIASQGLRDAGAYFSRPYGLWADLMYMDGEQNTMLLKQVKNLFDPRGIMNPGKLCFKEAENGA